MSDVLTKDEIDQLLTAIDEKDKSSAISRRIKIYDFKRPDKISKEQIRTIAIIFESFARLTTTSLSAQLRSAVHIHVASVDQLSYEEFVRTLSVPTTIAIFNMEPLKGNALLEINPEICFSILDRLLGGIGKGTDYHYELTDIEKSVMEEVISPMLENMQASWTQILDIHPRLDQIETNPQFAQIVPPTEIVVLVTLETTIGDIKSAINFCIPYLTIEPVFDKFSCSYGSRNTVTPVKKNNLVNREDIPVKLSAEILRRDFSIAEIVDWKEGTVILPLCHLTPNHCYLKLGDRRVWHGKIMEDEKNFPKKIVIEDHVNMPFGTEGRRMEMNTVNPMVTNALEMAKVRISAELGAATRTVKEVFEIAQGSVIELDKLAGEPVDVLANGVPIAKGEIVIIDENFGVRIIETAQISNPWVKQEAKVESGG